MKRQKDYDAFCGMYARISISGRHCSLIWDENAGDFVLTDLKSAYGTYLVNGKRLPSGVGYHLRAGDSFLPGRKRKSAACRAGVEK